MAGISEGGLMVTPRIASRAARDAYLSAFRSPGLSFPGFRAERGPLLGIEGFRHFRALRPRSAPRV